MDEADKFAYKLVGKIAACFGGLALLVFTTMGGWGSKGIKNEYSFQYQGKPAVVQREDIRLAPSNYWILLNNKDKLTNGKITSDEGKEISVVSSNLPLIGGSYTVKDKLTN